jgi:hypothetical protein
MSGPDPRAMQPDKALDALLQDALDGASEQWLAERADVSVQQVRLWKKNRGLSSDKKQMHESLAAIQGLVVDYQPARHMVENTIDFAGPRYVTRQALDYTQFSRMCHVLLESYAFSLRQIAHALGVSRVDVETATALYKRWLKTHGTKCLGCDLLIDVRFSKFCSRTCHDRAKRADPPTPPE